MLHAVKLGVRPTYAYTYQKCRVTGWEGWLPYTQRVFSNHKQDNRVVVVNANGMPATFVTIHPCHMASFIWHMKELNRLIDTLDCVTAAAMAPCTDEDAGRAIHDWMAYDKPISELMLMHLKDIRVDDPRFTTPLYRTRPLLWELFGAQRIVVNALPATKELYVAVVDDTPWIPASKKPSQLDK